MSRRAANCCLVLLVIPTVLVAYFWYTVWHTGRTNSERRENAVASLMREAQKAASDTGRALAESDPSAGAGSGIDALTGVVWRYSETPLITYDPGRHTFTATARRAVFYDEDPLVLGGGPVRITRCFRFTFALPEHSGTAWTSDVTVRDDEACGPSERIAGHVRFAQRRLAAMSPTDLTPDGVRRALDPTGTLDYYGVTGVVRNERTATVTVTVLVRDAKAAYATAGQCYRFVRDLDPVRQGADVPFVPLADCPRADRGRDLPTPAESSVSG
ncbi:hypothetical protein [Streptomyces caeruleatus]|uniref:Uncharacterized protein n=1 Tax=Streptomyces caeruleatus TaxID=661399 RepID=A0A124I9G8_9ACTN|nr:hypothetical protein [Streptomyces caeruleatus]KUO02522.1 hypothetical protein AQJ67_22095 [Streptomyces caeruleatus]